MDCFSTSVKVRCSSGNTLESLYLACSLKRVVTTLRWWYVISDKVRKSRSILLFDCVGMKCAGGLICFKF